MLAFAFSVVIVSDIARFVEDANLLTFLNRIKNVRQGFCMCSPISYFVGVSCHRIISFVMHIMYAEIVIEFFQSRLQAVYSLPTNILQEAT